MKDEKSTGKKKTTTKKVNTTKKTTTKKKTTSKASPSTRAKKTPVKKTVATSKKPITTEPKKAEEVTTHEPANATTVQKPAFNSRQFAMKTIMMVLAAVLIVVVLIIYFFQVKKNTYSVDWERKSYLVENEIAATDCEGVSNAILGDYNFVFVRPEESSEEEFNLEKKLLKIIRNYHLEGNFYVYTLDNSCGVITDPYSVLGQNLSLDEGINKVPTILYYKDGELVDYVTRDDEQMMSDADFVKLLDIYEFEK